MRCVKGVVCFFSSFIGDDGRSLTATSVEVEDSRPQPCGATVLGGGRNYFKREGENSEFVKRYSKPLFEKKQFCHNG